MPERIVLVSIDTLRADHVGAYGRANAHTATLDALAGEGVRFDAAFSPVPLTLPAHASLFTALDPPRHGVRHNSIFSLGPGPPTLAERMKASGHATAAFIGSLVLHSRFGLARGFDHYDESMGGSRSGMVGFAERKADQVVDAALAWLGTAPTKFFLFVHFYDPHAAYDPPPAYAIRFGSSPYDGEIAFTDAQLGRLLRAMDERFGSEGTLVLVTADHGESLGEHGEPSHSYSLYDATQRIPMILKGPGVPAGRWVGAPVRLVDVAPTLLQLAGLPALKDVDGRDLLPVIDGGERTPRVAYMETLATQLDFGWSPLFALRDDRTKFIRAPRPELYDLAADPGELTNRAAGAPVQVAALEAALGERLAREVPMRASVSLSDVERARLESLGYVVPTAADVDRAAAGAGGLDPKDGIVTLAVITKASTLLEKGRPLEALSLLEPLASPGPHVLGLRAAAALGAGRAKAAEENARAALAGGPERDDLLVLLGDSLMAQGRLEDAAVAFARARQIAPESVQPRIGLARVAEHRGDPTAAIAALREAYDVERAREASPEAAWRLAALLLERGEREEADRLLTGLPPGTLSSEVATVRIAQAELVAGRMAAALTRIEGGLEAEPNSLALLQGLAAIHESAGRDEEALAVRERIFALAPDAPAAQNDLAWALARNGKDLDRALELAERARHGAPAAADVIDTLALVRLRRGQPALVLALLTEADRAGVAMGPNLSLRRGQAYAALGRPREARLALDRAVSLSSPAERNWASEGKELAERLGVTWPPPSWGVQTH